MAQNVGPILEMVTEKYLLRGEAEWQARRHAVATLDTILGLLAAGDMRGLGRALTDNFFGPLQTIIPWVTSLYTERLIARTREAFGGDFWGFWMLGGMSGGGMGFVFAPERKAEGQRRLHEIMLQAKRELQDALPFAMDPVVYDFAINEKGSVAALLTGPGPSCPRPTTGSRSRPACPDARDLKSARARRHPAVHACGAHVPRVRVLPAGPPRPAAALGPQSQATPEAPAGDAGGNRLRLRPA